MTDDSHQWECPDCQALLPVGILKCKRCGYVRSKTEVQQQNKDHRLCSFVSSRTGQQCPLPGDISKSFRGDKWCSQHLDCHTGFEAERIYAEICRNLDEIKSAKSDDFHADPVGWYERHKHELPSAAKPVRQSSEQRGILLTDAEREAKAEREAIQSEKT